MYSGINARYGQVRDVGAGLPEAVPGVAGAADLGVWARVPREGAAAALRLRQRACLGWTHRYTPQLLRCGNI